MKKEKKIIFVIIFVVIIMIDQLTKILVKNASILPNVLEFEVVKNTGIAFGINSGNLKNIIITLLVLILIFNFIKKQFELINSETMLALSLMISGGMGNLIDRIFRGGVVDFIKIWKFPIFNIADIAIVVGWVLLVISIIKFSIKTDKNESK